jgi:hypothetical protein
MCRPVMLLSVVIVCQLSSWRVRALCTFGPSSDSGRLTSYMSEVLFER